ncbi:MAG: hypothetical protein IPN95_18300 [Bacteroidetes bacterium]|nr:hypothetical protein [Bacteroidota bacterium]
MRLLLFQEPDFHFFDAFGIVGNLVKCLNQQCLRLNWCLVPIHSVSIRLPIHAHLVVVEAEFLEGLQNRGRRLFVAISVQGQGDHALIVAVEFQPIAFGLALIIRTRHLAAH